MVLNNSRFLAGVAAVGSLASHPSLAVPLEWCAAYSHSVPGG